MVNAENLHFRLLIFPSVPRLRTATKRLSRHRSSKKFNQFGKVKKALHFKNFTKFEASHRYKENSSLNDRTCGKDKNTYNGADQTRTHNILDYSMWCDVAITFYQVNFEERDPMRNSLRSFPLLFERRVKSRFFLKWKHCNELTLVKSAF